MYDLQLHPPKSVRADGEDVVGETSSEHGHLHVSGFVLTADEAARRRAAFELAREQNLFKWHIDEQDDDGNTALHRATVYQKILTTKMLLCAGAVQSPQLLMLSFAVLQPPSVGSLTLCAHP